MPFATNRGIRIHYEVEGDGSPLVLVHGLTGNLESWYELGYVDSLKRDYKLVSIDVRGHGGSDKPHDPEAYKLELLVADVIAVMDALNISKTHFMGYSLGGKIGFGLAKYVPERFHSFIIGGANPYDKFDPDEVRWWLQLLKKGMSAVIEMFEETGSKIPPQRRAQLLANDTEALAAFVSAGKWRVNLEDALPHMTMPCLLFAGEADLIHAGARKCAEVLPNAEFISFPGLSHLEAFFQSHLVLPHIKKFLAKVVTRNDTASSQNKGSSHLQFC